MRLPLALISTAELGGRLGTSPPRFSTNAAPPPTTRSHLLRTSSGSLRLSSARSSFRPTAAFSDDPLEPGLPARTVAKCQLRHRCCSHAEQQLPRSGMPAPKPAPCVGDDWAVNIGEPLAGGSEPAAFLRSTTQMSSRRQAWAWCLDRGAAVTAVLLLSRKPAVFSVQPLTPNGPGPPAAERVG
jgi:hypothetical protein